MRLLASIDLDALIPLIVGVFWVVAQIAGAAAKKKPSSPATPQRRVTPSTGDPFENMVRSFREAKDFELDLPPQPKPEPIPVPPVNAVPPLHPDKVQENTIGTPYLQPTPESISVPKVEVRPTMKPFKTAMPSMKLPSMGLRFQGLERSGSDIPRIEKIVDPADQRTLRRAILGQIILGHPRALDGWDTGRME